MGHLGVRPSIFDRGNSCRQNLGLESHPTKGVSVRKTACKSNFVGVTLRSPSKDDPVITGLIRAAGNIGFRDVVVKFRKVPSFGEPRFETQNLVRPNLGKKFTQHELPGIWHSQVTARGHLSWVDAKMVAPHYRDIFQIRAPRREIESDNGWIRNYQSFRNSLTIEPQVRWSPYYFEKYEP